MNEWIAGAFGLGGTVIGGGASFAGTAWQQRKAAEAGKEAAENSAAATLAAELVRIRQHLNALPDGLVSRPSENKSEATQVLVYAIQSDWHAKLGNLIVPAEVATRILRDADIRGRELEIFDLLGRWPILNFQQAAIMNRYSMGEIVNHALECAGAWQRQDEMPPTAPALIAAREVWRILREKGQ
ncbi:hypothetical protein [Streptomyces sp. NPDC048436]|uniref:hypothetical protein n=1 Tax=Streptomyces sp. NPDC048436 TaxID=3365550 RepID=UPI00371CD3DB